MSGNAEEMAAMLQAAAVRVCAVVRRGSPAVSDRELLGVMALATGMFWADAYFPDTMMDHPKMITSLGRLVAAGAQLGRAARTEKEIASCEGAA